MKKQSFLLLTVLMLMVPFMGSSQEDAKAEDHSYKPMQLKLNEDGSKYLRIITWHQMWLQAGSEQKGLRHSIRRSRVLAFAQISPKFLILTHFGLNSLGAANLTANPNSQTANNRSLLFLHDAWAEFAIEPGKLHVGTGLHYWNGISRLSNQSTLNMMTLDNAGSGNADGRLFPWNNITTSDQFARHLGVYAKGSLGNFSYRVAANNARTNIGSLGATPSFQVDNVDGAGLWNFAGYFFVVDVLQCIGLSLIILVGLHTLLKKHSYIFSIVLFTIGSICFVTEPLYRSLTLEHVPVIIANYVSKTNGSVFTILPWFGYSAYGAFISTVFFRHVHRDRFRLNTIITFFAVGIFLIHFSSWFLLKLHGLTHIELLKMSADYNYLFSRLGDVLMLFGVFYSLERFLKQSIIARIGEKTLSIYVIHFVLLYGSFSGYGLKRFLSQSLEPSTAIFGAILFMIVVCFISFHYAKTNAFVYNLIRKMINTFKNR